MKRNAMFRIALWGTILFVLLALFFFLLYTPGADRRLRGETPAETMVAVALPRVATEDLDSGNAITIGDLNVRSAPNSDARVVAFAEEGTVLNILRTETIGSIQWGYIGAPTQGWVAMEYVQTLEPVENGNGDILVTAPTEEPQATTSSDVASLQANAVAMDAASVRNMEIEWAAGSIRIQPLDITEIRITEEGANQDADPMVWNVRNGQLNIQYSKNTDHSFGMGLLLGEHSKNLLIQVPRDWQCDSLEIDAASASLEVNELTIREMEFDGASGTCVFHNCTVEALELDTASGDIRFTGTLTQLDCDSASANILLELDNTPKRLDLDTASGDLCVVLPEDAGFTVKLDTMSGDFESDFDTTLRNDSYVAGSGRCRIDVDAMSGDVTIRKAA